MSINKTRLQHNEANEEAPHLGLLVLRSISSMEPRRACACRVLASSQVGDTLKGTLCERLQETSQSKRKICLLASILNSPRLINLIIKINNRLELSQLRKPVIRLMFHAGWWAPSISIIVILPMLVCMIYPVVKCWSLMMLIGLISNY